MHHDEDQLNFAPHLAQSKQFFVNGNEKSNNYFTHQAQHNHALSVWGGSQELILKVVMLSDDVKAPNAQTHLRYGLGHRTRTIWQTVLSHL